MKLFIVAVTIFLAWAEGSVIENVAGDKTKRTVVGQVQNYGDARPVLFYRDHTQSLASLYSPVTLQPDIVQFYQPISKETASSSQFPAGSGSQAVASPIYHNTAIRHGQNFGQVQYNPFQQQIQTHQYIPDKLLYVNGKLTYRQNGYPQQNSVRKSMNYMTYTQPQMGAQKFIPSSLIVRPTGMQRFSPPASQQVQQITKTMHVPQVTEPQNEKEENPVTKADDKPEEEEGAEVEDDEKENFEEEEEDDDARFFSKYYFDDDEDDKLREEEEDDEDNERRPSKPIFNKYKKKVFKPTKYTKGDGFTYGESYRSSDKFEKPTKKNKKLTKNYSKSAPKLEYPKDELSRSEKIEGKQSQNIPVIHKQKIFKEKWFVTKSTDDSNI